MLPFQMSSSEGPGSDTEGDLRPEGNAVTNVDGKEEGSEAKNQAKGEAEGKKRKWNRGKHMTPSKRARQFVGVMEVREDKMWCLACDCPIQHSDKSIADSHVKSKKHLLATKPCISHSELTPKMSSNFRKVTPLGRYGTFWKHE